MPDAAVLPTPPPAEVEHRLPGRVRLRVRTLRGDAAFFRQVEAGLADIGGVRRVRTDPRTGSILIEHDRGDDTDVLDAARESGLFAVAQSCRAVVVRRAAAPPHAARAACVSPLDMAALAMAAAGLVQLARGKVVGSASENLWNAYGVFAMTRMVAPTMLLVAFGLMQVARGEVLGSATSLFLYAFSARRLARQQAPAEAAL